MRVLKAEAEIPRKPDIKMTMDIQLDPTELKAWAMAVSPGNRFSLAIPVRLKAISE